MTQTSFCLFGKCIVLILQSDKVSVHLDFEKVLHGIMLENPQYVISVAPHSAFVL